MDETTLKMKDPPLAYVPALTTRGTVLAFGDNRLADLASKAQHAVVGSPRMIPDAIHLKPFPFDKARCDGIGCVMKYTWPSLIGSVFFITIQSFLTRVGQEKERGIKEALYVAGTSQWAYWASWLTAKSFDMIFPSLIFSVLLFATEIFIKQNFAFIFFSCYLFGIASLVQMIFVQALLKTGQQIMMAGTADASAHLSRVPLSTPPGPLRGKLCSENYASCHFLFLFLLMRSTPCLSFVFVITGAQ